MSLELPLAEVHRLSRLTGFEVVRQEFVDAAYIGGGWGWGGGVVGVGACLGIRAELGNKRIWPARKPFI